MNRLCQACGFCLRSCNRHYVLYPRGTAKPTESMLGAAATRRVFVETPIQNVIATESQQLAFIEALGERSRLVAAENAVSPCVNNLKVSGAVAETWPSSYAEEPMGELDLNLAEDVFDATQAEWIIASTFEFANYDGSRLDDNLICDELSSEETVMAQAEWLKYFGPFFNKSDHASEVYCNLYDRYQCTKQLGQSLKPSLEVEIPKLLYISIQYLGTAVQVKDYASTPLNFRRSAVEDAGGLLPDLSPYAGFDVYGSKQFDESNVTERDLFHEAISKADVLIFEANADQYSETISKIRERFLIDSSLIDIPAFVNGRVYSTDGTLSETVHLSYGTKLNDDFESRFTQPDTYLEDIISILYPTSDNFRSTPWDLRYLRHVSTGLDAGDIVGAASCTDVTAPYEFRATTCQTLSSNTESSELLTLFETTSCPANHGNDGLSSGAIVAIAVGAGVALALVVIVLIVMSKCSTAPAAKAVV